ncbi:hypothetical protein SSS_01440 [Sarcoptes scabiei]|uniref:Origin recognition complex subunit 3 N-terminal domain-containing protein n=1 Tax=Sarcoptes scabiei TaxID=52283 RepID=A0A834R3I9_SARSC|nr:hypothetical protein SSS_01440 [Sarcoptes scabiei]
MMDIDSSVCEYYRPSNQTISIPKMVIRKRKKSSKKFEIKKSRDCSSHQIIKSSWPRQQLSLKYWTIIETKIDQKLDKLFTKTVEFLIEFIEKEMFQKSILDFVKIPTAIMFSDSLATSIRVVENVMQKISRKVISITLNTFDDSMQSVINQFMSQIQNHFTDDIDAKDHLVSIEDIINHLIYDDDVPIKNLMIVINDFDKFNMNVLNRLILILKQFKSRLSIGLIFFKNDLLNSNLINYLPMNTIDHLYVEIIDNDLQELEIENLIEDLIFDPEMRLKFHPKFLKKLTDHFKRYDLTIEAFKLSLKTSLFYYFFFNPLTILLDEEFETLIKSDSDISLLFENSISSLPSTKIENDDYLEAYRITLHDNHKFMIDLKIILDLFRILNLPTQNFIYYYWNIYSKSNGFEFQNELKRLLDTSQSRMQTALIKLKNLYSDSSLSNLLILLNDFESKLAHQMQEDCLERSKQAESAKKLGLECQIEIVKSKLRNISSRNDLKKLLEPSQKKNLNEYQKSKLILIDEIQKSFESTRFDAHRGLIDSIFCNVSLQPYRSNRFNLKSVLSLVNPLNNRPYNLAVFILAFRLSIRFLSEKNL